MNNYLVKNKKKYINDLKELIKIKSKLEKSNEYPNKEMKKAIKFMENIAKRDNIKYFSDEEGYYGYIEIGCGEEIIGILGHLDVVPEGNVNNWETNPFELIEKNDKLFGRGTGDNKGPLLLSYYLLKELKELDIKLTKRIRLIYATDEETFWRGIEKYKKNEEMPNIGYTPDASFPVIYSERELVNYKIIDNKKEKFELFSGTAPNVVPNQAKLIMNNKEKIEKGISAHAMNPEKGENAAYKLINKINDYNSNLIKFIKNELINETNGIKLFERKISDENATITVNLGITNIDNKENYIILDMRIPSTSNEKDITKLLNEKVKKYNLKIEIYDKLNGVYIDKNSKIIKLMIESYEEITNEKMIPTTTGGATYARSMKNIVAFGPFFKDSPKTEHQENEYVLFSDFVKSYSIYKKLIIKLLN